MVSTASRGVFHMPEIRIPAQPVPAVLHPTHLIANLGLAVGTDATAGLFQTDTLFPDATDSPELLAQLDLAAALIRIDSEGHRYAAISVLDENDL